ncbi:MAG: UDP-N-acetylglucosamine 2-epimerase (non-hydrolyzing) [Thermodesulfovibrionales bacterium]|nr:UDP-N-acetylglucosamine 2-epimerase (non-hydrolyzing) [Thermodesulfovibrionales bacterium]
MKVLFCFGTRPEAIKMAPLVKKLKKMDDKFEVAICLTAQHREMLDQVMTFFNLSSDYDLNIMKKNQTLYDITISSLEGIRDSIRAFKPDIVLVQGDTTTTFTGALSSFYEKIPIGHIEAGLRSFNKYSPYPEEINRVLTTHLSTLHFAPTQRAVDNLIKESIDSKKIFLVGNTSIDALFLCLELIKSNENFYTQRFQYLNPDKKLILVTGHRRESFGEPFKNICNAIKEIASKRDVEIVYPVHLNPNVRKPVFDILSEVKNIHLIEPLDYPNFVYLMNRSYLILTDSGGVQEEAPSLGKPVLVMREVTERTEGIDAGTARLVGTEFNKIIHETMFLLDDEAEYSKMANAVNPYGDGKTSDRIAEILWKSLT